MVEDKNKQVYNLTEKYKGIWTVFNAKGEEIKYSIVFEENNKA